MSDKTTLIPATLRAHLARLRIAARLPPPPGPLGQNASRQRGQGLEFSQYRAYEHGDEPRHIDWKLFARADRYFVRDAEREAGLAVWVVLDATASMQQADLATPERSKWTVARTLAAATIDIAHRQGDRFGLLLVRDGTLDWTPAQRGPRHRDRCLLALLRATCAGTWPGMDALRPAWGRIEPSSIVLAIGDGFDPNATDFALQLAATRRDVRSIALTAVDERDFALRGACVFEDPETGARIEADAAAVAASFRANFAQARGALAHTLAAGGVLHVEHAVDQPPERTLRAVLGAGAR
ncbi:DUF58 domain-containing protein [Chiayiivirga flava]|uniref:Uncharacterized protein (DUF58 family) n=1 Tax=Chiayiivirga flava TaxID=659595 RepID=A0A7W8G2B2_9GAMM|nr:DUF58 domain-containing protein [Chiayiivirga flava]MBB5209783.1 uncharacterized protein (DUF58 family) [Chiayiivirga flava]